MGVKRIIDTDFWKDSKVIDYYSPQDKYFWLYLLTNPQSRQLGVYKLPKKIIAFETGYDLDTVNVLLRKFQNEYQSIIYSEHTQEIAILNYLKYSIIKGGKPVIDCIIKDISLVSNKSLIAKVHNHIKDIDDSRETMTRILEITSGYNDNDNDNDNDNESNVPRIVKRNVSRIADKPKQEKIGVDYSKIINDFKTMCPNLPIPQKMTDSRKKTLDAWIKDSGIEQVKEVFEKVKQSDFLSGRVTSSNGWKATFDWIIKPSNRLKILEGNYDNVRNQRDESKNKEQIPTLLAMEMDGEYY